MKSGRSNLGIGDCHTRTSRGSWWRWKRRGLVARDSSPGIRRGRNVRILPGGSWRGTRSGAWPGQEGRFFGSLRQAGITISRWIGTRNDRVRIEKPALAMTTEEPRKGSLKWGRL